MLGVQVNASPPPYHSGARSSDAWFDWGSSQWRLDWEDTGPDCQHWLRVGPVKVSYWDYDCPPPDDTIPGLLDEQIPPPPAPK
jgi:hypothetical protein